MKYTIQNITKFLDLNFPVKKGELWDHNGIIMGSLKSPLTSILIAIDLTPKVMKKAIDKNISMIITHHPFFFEPTLSTEFKKNPYKKSIVQQLNDTGIAYYSLHTSYDVSPKGMKEAIVTTLGIKRENYQIVNKYGILFSHKDITVFGSLIKMLKRAFNVQTIDYFGKKYQELQINKIGILPGSGDLETIQKLKKEGADIIITSDVKWSQLICIKEIGIPLLSISHYMENIFTDHVASMLKKNFPTINIETIDVKYLFKKV